LVVTRIESTGEIQLDEGAATNGSPTRGRNGANADMAMRTGPTRTKRPLWRAASCPRRRPDPVELGGTEHGRARRDR